MKHDIKVGQILYEKKVGGIEEMKVAKVGRANLYLFDRWGAPDKEGFKLDTLEFHHRDFSQFNRKLYLSKEAIEEEHTMNYIASAVNKVFANYGLKKVTDEQYLKIAEILNISYPS